MTATLYSSTPPATPSTIKQQQLFDPSLFSETQWPLTPADSPPRSSRSDSFTGRVLEYDQPAKSPKGKERALEQDEPLLQCVFSDRSALVVCALR